MFVIPGGNYEFSLNPNVRSKSLFRWDVRKFMLKKRTFSTLLHIDNFIVMAVNRPKPGTVKGEHPRSCGNAPWASCRHPSEEQGLKRHA